MSEARAGAVLSIDTTWDGRPAGPGERATLHVRRMADGGLALTFEAPFHGDAPPAAPPGPTDRLWEHEVVEFFVAGPGDPVPYTEVEVGPYGHQLTLRLRGVRQVEASLLPLEVNVRRGESRWTAEATLPAALLPPPPWRALACAVHGPPEARRYLCSPALPGPKPDFHQPDRWSALRI